MKRNERHMTSMAPHHKTLVLIPTLLLLDLVVVSRDLVGLVANALVAAVDTLETSSISCSTLSRVRLVVLVLDKLKEMTFKQPSTLLSLRLAKDPRKRSPYLPLRIVLHAIPVASKQVFKERRVIAAMVLVQEHLF